MQPERADNGRNGIFINTGLPVQDLLITGSIFIRCCNGGLNIQGNLGIRDNRDREESMGMVAGVAEEPGNSQGDDVILQTQFACIAAIPDQASGVSAGAGNEV